MPFKDMVKDRKDTNGLPINLKDLDTFPPKTQEIRKPHLRIAITPLCNFNCVYCRPGGEGVCVSKDVLTFDEIISLAEIAIKVGFCDIKITGGEPTMRKDLLQIIRGISKIEGLSSLGLITNGSLLSFSDLSDLFNNGLKDITFSLDASSSEKFTEITKKNSFEKVINNINYSKSIGLNVTINSVIMKSNIQELDGLINISKRAKATLKLLDFMAFDSNKGFWKEEYYDFRRLREELAEEGEFKGFMLPPGGLGTPMPLYDIRGVNVLLKDSTIGTNYNFDCKKCKYFPCQDALISLRITSDGRIKPCLIRDDNLVNLKEQIKKGDFSTIYKILQEKYNLFVQSSFIKNAWNPENEKAK